MSELRLETYRLPAANLGGQNPLPALHALDETNIAPAIDENVPQKDRKYIGYGLGAGMLPYKFQDDYDRNKKPRNFQAVVLENEVLRATFLPELGGRLYSLFHKPTKKELLYVNPVFQPGNLAIRNAWFGGGIEWNIAIRGHSVFTCSQIFTATLKDDDGTPILRMYEWERIRKTPYQIDFYLPDGSEFLFVRVRIVNPNKQETPMYWWSNSGVPETPETRIIVPAQNALSFAYGNFVKMVPTPQVDGVDVTYPTNIQQAMDFFYRIDDNRWPWEAALEKDGSGIIQSSTSLLRGRKLFLWGMAQGGRHWDEFLSIPDDPQIEIQAGLARTQQECLPMPPDACWEWLEAYGLMQADPKIVHGSDYSKASQHVEELLSKKVTHDWLEKELLRTKTTADRRPDEIILRGSGWGALEQIRRENQGQKPFCNEGMVFDDQSIKEEENVWLTLLNEGKFQYSTPKDAQYAWMVQDEWRELLEQAVKQKHSDHWLSWLHLGVIYYYRKQFDNAKDAWQKSLELEPSAIVQRNLAVIAADNGDTQKAADLLLKACELAPRMRQLTIECFYALLKAGRPREVIDSYNNLTEEIKGHGRVKFLMGIAALELNDLNTVENLFKHNIIVPDMREGEVSLSDLWFKLHEKRLATKENIPIYDKLRQRVRSEFPPPAEIDFRMKT